MPFVHPVIFWSGLGSIAVPVVIHLLNRRRFRTREWAAMKFLLDSLRKNRRRLKIEELILLLLRCLVVLLLVVAAARFSGCAALEALPFGGAEGENAVFIMDDSYSMGQRAGVGTIFDAAATDMGEQLRSLPGSPRFAIIPASSPAGAAKLAELRTITDIGSLVNDLKERRLSDRRADFAAALKAAKQMFAEVVGPKRLYIQSDFRRVDFASPQQAEELRRLFGELQRAEVTIIAADYGRGPRDNLTIEKIELTESQSGYKGLLLTGWPFRVRVTVRNNSPVAVDQVKVSLEANFAAEKAPDYRTGAADQIISYLRPGQSRACDFDVTCRRPGAAVLKAELAADELAGDNVGFLAIDVHGAIAALIVDDRKRAGEAAESYFLRAALPAGAEDGYSVITDVVTSSELADKALDDYDVVILLNVAEFPVVASGEAGGVTGCPQVEGLEQYVRAGGGLAVFTGDRVDTATAFYNRYLHGGGAGLCPYQIGSHEGDPKQSARYFRMKVARDPAARSAGGRVMRFARIGDVDLTEFIRFYAFTPARLPKSLDAPADEETDVRRPIILARFNDPAESPAVVLRPFGQGKVLMYYTTANRRWTDWPAEGSDYFYVPAINEMVRFLASRLDPALNGLAGEPFDFNVPRRLSDAEAELSLLGGQTPQISRHWSEVGRRLRWEDTLVAGGYAIRFARPGLAAEAVFFARNGDSEEGKLATGGQTVLNAVIPGKYEYTRRGDDGQSGPIWTKPAKEYWAWALAAMLGFLALETYLARKFGHYT